MQKNDPKMTNLKAGSGSTVMPVQGPQICPILGDFWWPSNRRFVDPEPSLKGLRSAERSVFFWKKWAPNWLRTRGQMWSPNREKCAALCDGWLSGWCLDGPNRQSLAFSERGQLSQAIRQLDMTANKR